MKCNRYFWFSDIKSVWKKFLNLFCSNFLFRFLFLLLRRCFSFVWWKSSCPFWLQARLIHCTNSDTNNHEQRWSNSRKVFSFKFYPSHYFCLDRILRLIPITSRHLSTGCCSCRKPWVPSAKMPNTCCTERITTEPSPNPLMSGWEPSPFWRPLCWLQCPLARFIISDAFLK